MRWFSLSQFDKFTGSKKDLLQTWAVILSHCTDQWLSTANHSSSHDLLTSPSICTVTSGSMLAQVSVKCLQLNCT